MNRLTSSALASSLLLVSGGTVKADYDYLQVSSSGSKVTILGVNTNGDFATLKTFTTLYGNPTATAFVDEYNGLLHIGGNGGYHTYDPETGEVSDLGIPNDNPKFLMTYPWKGKNVLKENSDGSVQIGADDNDVDVVADGLNIDGAAVLTKNEDGSVQIGADGDDIDIVGDGLNIDGYAVITKNEDGSIQIGADGDDIDITSEGLTVDGVSLITKKESGEIHIGKNSLITIEEAGVQQLYAKDADDNAINIDVTNGSKLLINGKDVEQSIETNTSNIAINSSNINSISSLISKSTDGVTSIGENSLKLQETSGSQKMWATNSNGEIAPIDITNGTKLLINGRDVEQSIDNVGALSAALTGLPTIPQDSPLSCGVGAGAHSGSNALSGGCATRVNNRLTFNAAASFIPSKQEYQGSDNAWSGRAGFVFKLGKIKNPTLISMKEKKNMQAKITELSTSNTKIQTTNQKIQSQNKDLQAKVDSFQFEKAALVARLEKLEQIALSNQKDEKTASSFFSLSNLFSTMKGYLPVAK